MSAHPLVIRCHLCGEPMRESKLHKCPHGKWCGEHLRTTASLAVEHTGEPECAACRKAFRRQLKLPGVK